MAGIVGGVQHNQMAVDNEITDAEIKTLYTELGTVDETSLMQEIEKLQYQGFSVQNTIRAIFNAHKAANPGKSKSEILIEVKKGMSKVTTLVAIRGTNFRKVLPTLPNDSRSYFDSLISAWRISTSASGSKDTITLSRVAACSPEVHARCICCMPSGNIRRTNFFHFPGGSALIPYKRTSAMESYIHWSVYFDSVINPKRRTDLEQIKAFALAAQNGTLHSEKVRETTFLSLAMLWQEKKGVKGAPFKQQYQYDEDDDDQEEEEEEEEESSSQAKKRKKSSSKGSKSTDSSKKSQGTPNFGPNTIGTNTYSKAVIAKKFDSKGEVFEEFQTAQAQTRKKAEHFIGTDNEEDEEGDNNNDDENENDDDDGDEGDDDHDTGGEGLHREEQEEEDEGEEHEEGDQGAVIDNDGDDVDGDDQEGADSSGNLSLTQAVTQLTSAFQNIAASSDASPANQQKSDEKIAPGGSSGVGVDISGQFTRPNTAPTDRSAQKKDKARKQGTDTGTDQTFKNANKAGSGTATSGKPATTQ